MRAYARACGSGSRQTVGRGNEGISAVVDVQQRTLRAFKQQFFAVFVFLVQHAGHVGNHRRNAQRDFFDNRHHVFRFNRLGIVQMLQLDIVIGKDGIQFFTQFFRMQQIGGANGAACHFVFVGRADAAAGRADFAFAARCFAGLVERDVVRQDQRAGRRDFQTAFDVFHACSV
ncbi:Uncharacterised protein [Neisseria meningitidis]|nr:Uncharacterised protein [Neisseria meningitidis]CWN76394.1 Uncharacterised protein [Neisseria meningitidis]CWO60842.1 Uncharacterised protein [Neisseria meningitidis]CWS22315.1 Uncharacterised protein [Neisseria meningitidis]CWS32895.1 Uncharacterised protein [Neisseria meningitidis]